MVKQFRANRGKQPRWKSLKASGRFRLDRAEPERERTVSFSQGLASATVIAKVNGELWDSNRPFEKSATLQLIKFDDEEGETGTRPLFYRVDVKIPSKLGKQVFWHSTAHIMGEAMELCYGGCLCYGPPIEQGFYYDMYLENRYVQFVVSDASRQRFVRRLERFPVSITMV